MNSKNYDDKIKYFNELSYNWDEIVGNDENRITKLRDVFTMIHINNGDTVLDVGCGTGVLFAIILQKIGITYNNIF